MSEKEINKILKPNILMLIIPIVMLIIGIVLFVYSFMPATEPSKEDALLYGDLISNYKDDNSIQYVKINIVYIENFAHRDNENYYFAIDNSNYLYIVRIKDDTFNKIKNKYEKDKDNFSYEIYGWTHIIPEDLKKLAITSINEFYNSDFKLTTENYEDYLGNTYLDEVLSASDYRNSVYMGVGIILIIFGALGFLLFSVPIINTRKSLNNYDIYNIRNELSSSDTLIYKKEHIYLSNNYIISTLKGIRIFNYSDIYWLYKEDIIVNGIRMGTLLNARLTSKKLVSIARTSLKSDILVEIMNQIHNKNNSILIGFTKENQKEFNKYKREI